MSLMFCEVAEVWEEAKADACLILDSDAARREGSNCRQRCDERGSRWIPGGAMGGWAGYTQVV